MSRLSVILAACMLALSQGFMVNPSVASKSTALFEAERETKWATGVSIDQEGKSNVWAVEPKMEVSNQSSEESTQKAVIAGGGIAVAAGLAAVILTNLPDPNQF